MLQNTIINYDLSFYVNKIEKSEPFVFARYGDGEWNAMFEKTGQNCDGHKYFKQMGEDLKESLNGYSYPNYFMGLQNLATTMYDKNIYDLLKAKNINITWHNSDVFHYASIDGKLLPLIETLKKKNVIFIGPEYLKKISEIIPYSKFIVVPDVDCYLEKEKVINKLSENPQDAIYSFSASMLTEILLYELYKNLKKATLIDFGSLWDPFIGKNSRIYHKEMSKETIHKNLGEQCSTILL